MAKYVIEDTTLTGIADAIRGKTGGTDPIPVTDMASQIAAITGGGSSDDSGGSVEGIVYVTFMNGNTELCKTACMKGDSTVDPLEDGKIAVPTKEPTISTVYTYAGGWSLTDGGEANAAALVDVTEDRVVYAVYAESAREYTINFWIAEGELHESLQVAYGETPSPSRAEKNGYYFDSWTPELTAVTGDADYVAVWSEASPWETVAQVVANGTYKSVYKLGDTLSLELGDYGIVDMQIIAFDTDEKADGSGKAAITWLSKDVFAVRVMNSTATNANGWAATEMRAWLRSDVFAALPADVQSAIVPVNKTYYDYATKSTLSCEDTLWIPSMRELFGNHESSGATYTDYFTNANSRIKYNNNGVVVPWWARSATVGSNYFAGVTRTGTADYSSANNSVNCATLGFCT